MSRKSPIEMELAKGTELPQKQERMNMKSMVELATADRGLALILPLLGIMAVVFLFAVASGDNDGSAKELLATAVTAVTTLAAASGGHAAGAKRRSSTK